MDNKIVFATNVAQELRLAALEGDPVEGRFGDQYKFETVDGRVFWVSVTVGQIIEKQLLALKVAIGEPVDIGKFEVDMGRGRKGIQWIVRRVNPEADGDAPAPQRIATSPATEMQQPHATRPAITTGWAQYLLEQTTALTDVFAAAVRYSQEMHGDAVKPDDIRSILLSAYINASKGGQRERAA